MLNQAFIMLLIARVARDETSVRPHLKLARLNNKAD